MHWKSMDTLTLAVLICNLANFAFFVIVLEVDPFTEGGKKTISTCSISVRPLCIVSAILHLQSVWFWQMLDNLSRLGKVLRISLLNIKSWREEDKTDTKMFLLRVPNLKFSWCSNLTFLLRLFIDFLRRCLYLESLLWSSQLWKLLWEEHKPVVPARDSIHKYSTALSISWVEYIQNCLWGFYWV